MKYVSPLSEEQIEELETLLKNHPTHRVRMRAHSILLSSRGFCITKIAEIYQLDRDSVSSWIDKWEVSGIDGLFDKPRSGSPSILDESEKEIAKELIKKYPRSMKTVIAELFQKTGKKVSEWTLKRLAKTTKLSWKRVKKGLKLEPDEKEVEQAKQDIDLLKQQEDAGEIDLFSFDETGFSLESAIPYAWQPIGGTIEIPNAKSSRLNVAGFISRKNQLYPFSFKCTINSAVVVACFDYFSEQIIKKSVVLIDNAPIHTSDEFNENIKKWEAKGLFIYRLPKYSPQLNFIEILWRFIKYSWIPFSAYKSFKDLVIAVEEILKNIGSKYRINFA